MLAAYPPVFAGLSMDASQEAASALQQIEVDAGGAIMIEGEQDTTLAFIVSGSCEIWQGETQDRHRRCPRHHRRGRALRPHPSGGLGHRQQPRHAPDPRRRRATTLSAIAETRVIYALERAALRRISDRLRTMNNSIRSNSEGTPFELHPQRAGLLSGLMSAFMRQKKPDIDAATVLAASDLYSWAPGHIVQDISEHFEVEEFKKDAMICRQGDDGDSMFVLATGSVEVVLLVGPERAESVATLVPGQAFGDAIDRAAERAHGQLCGPRGLGGLVDAAGQVHGAAWHGQRGRLDLPPGHDPAT